MDGVGLDTGRHCCVWYVERILVSKNIPKGISTVSAITTDHENMLVFTRLRHFNEFP